MTLLVVGLGCLFLHGRCTSGDKRQSEKGVNVFEGCNSLDMGCY